MKPSAVLVRPFEIEIRGELRLIGMRAQVFFTAERPAHRGLMRRAGIEPDIDRIGEFAITRLVDAKILAPCGEPRFYAALRDFRRRQLDQRERIGMQRVRGPVDKEGQGNAPLTLPRQGPVGTVGDHPIQARLAPRGIERGCVDAGKRRCAQRGPRFSAVESGNAVHPREPLRRRAVDDRRLVPPAMHVAVRKLFSVEQRACLANLVDNPRIRIPDPHATKKRQIVRESPISLDRIEHVIIAHAIAAARSEVVDAVRG